MNALFEKQELGATVGNTPDRPGARPVILLADDDPAIRRILYRLLIDEGYSVITAGSGAEALEIASMTRIDLLLLDIDVPIQESWKVFAQISINQTALPVVLITAQPDQFFHALTSDVGALLEKPLDLTKLFVTIHNLLEEPVSVRLARAIERPAAFNSIPPVAKEPARAWIYQAL